MKKAIFFKILIVCFCLAALISCAKKDTATSNQLIVGLASEPERLNPITIKDPQTFPISWQIYEGLLGLDEEGKILPKIAENWETKDNKTWIFKIRKGVKFHNSELFDSSDKTRTITAQDALYSYTRFCSPESYPSFVLADSIKGCSEYNTGKAKMVDGLKVIDEYTFQIELNKPEPFFINRITSPWIAIFPKESEKDNYKDKWGLTLAVGTGPFRLASKTDNEVVLVKNENYWDKNRTPKIERIVYRIIKNDQIRFSEINNGKIDLMVLPNQLFSFVFDQDGKIKTNFSSNFNFKITGTFNTHLIGINLKKIPDVHLRKAIFYGTNREEMVQKILYNYGDVIAGAVPPGMNGYEPLIKNPYNPEMAKQELKKSNYKGKEIELLVHELANSEQIGQIFQKQMNDIGIKIRLTKVDFNSAIGRMVKGDAELFSMFAEVVFSSPEPLLLNLFSTGKMPAPNFWGYSNSGVDKKMEGLRDISDRATSVKTAAEIEKEIMEEVPANFLYRQKNVVMYSNKFKNLKINSHNYYMLEQMEKKQ